MTKPFSEFDRVNQWDLPETIDPERICVCFEIPNERFHIRAFWTALYKLSIWNSWATDEAHTGTKVAAVWRDVWNKAIGDNTTMGCCCPEPTQTRINEQGFLEVSYDGGETWQLAPQLDPRFTGTTAPMPGADGDAKRCLAAQSAAEYINGEVIDQMNDSMTFAVLFQLLMSVIAIIITGGTAIPVIVPIILELVGAVFTVGVTALQGAFDATQLGILQCILYCHCDAAGNFSASAWSQIIADIETDIDPVCADTVKAIVKAMGAVGLTNAAHAGLTTGITDCSGCDCFQGCSDKYQVGPISNPTGHGIILSNDGTTIRVQAQDPGNGVGYVILEAETLGDCCYVNLVEAEVGATVLANFFIPCGTPYSEGAWVNATPVGQCCQLIQIQTQVGAVIAITVDECP